MNDVEWESLVGKAKADKPCRWGSRAGPPPGLRGDSHGRSGGESFPAGGEAGRERRACVSAEPEASWDGWTVMREGKRGTRSNRRGTGAGPRWASQPEGQALELMFVQRADAEAFPAVA